ncbi:MAG: TolC family protein [Verrucomicrobia bacterium]|nr:TolC family protein [Verrucomicrobiota bacterium]
MFQLRRCHPIACVIALGLAGILAGQTADPLAGAMAEELLPQLKPILQRALERSPEQVRRAIEIEQAEARSMVSKAIMLPNLGGYGRYAVNRAATASAASSATSNSSGFFYDVGISQPVYHWGALKAQLEIDRIGEKIARREFADAARLLAAQLRKSYLELVAKKGAQRAEKRGLELAAKGLAREEERFKNRETTPGDITTARNLFQEAQLRFDRSVAEYGFMKRVFARLAGIDELPDEAIPAGLPRPVPLADHGQALLRDFLRGGAVETFRGQVFALGVLQSDLNYSIAKTGLLPKFSFNAGHNVSNVTQADITQVRQEAIVQNTFGLLVNWTIFDSGATRGRRLEALAKKRSYERQLQTYVEATGDLAQYLRQQAEFASRALDFSENRLGGARTGVEQARESLSRGRASADDVERAEAGLLGAEAENAAVRAEFLNRWTEFVSLVGADPAMKNLPPRYVR